MRYSHVVSHHSTNLTSGRLTSGIRRDPVLLTVYGRNWKLNRYVGVKGLGWVRGGLGWIGWRWLVDTAIFAIFQTLFFRQIRAIPSPLHLHSILVHLIKGFWISENFGRALCLPFRSICSFCINCRFHVFSRVIYALSNVTRCSHKTHQ